MRRKKDRLSWDIRCTTNVLHYFWPGCLTDFRSGRPETDVSKYVKTTLDGGKCTVCPQLFPEDHPGLKKCFQRHLTRKNLWKVFSTVASTVHLHWRLQPPFDGNKTCTVYLQRGQKITTPRNSWKELFLADYLDIFLFLASLGNYVWSICYSIFFNLQCPEWSEAKWWQRLVTMTS